MDQSREEREWRAVLVRRYLGRLVTVTVDRPLGSTHPEHPEIYYPINYGYIPGELAPDGEYLDAYVLGVNEPLESFSGQVIAIIHRADDVEDKLVVAPEGTSFTPEEIAEAVAFHEKYYQTRIEIWRG
jgi:inorganic pyrophosphatase